MARTAILGRLTWRVATISAIHEETDAARTLLLDVPDWPGHLAGQHVDIRLTAEDGYTAQRSYSLASADAVSITVQRVAEGEVSSYLVDGAQPGDRFEIRGPVGGYFTWEPAEESPVLLVAGGSGIVPLMSMIRARALSGQRAPFRLIYSVRDPGSVIYADELEHRAGSDAGLEITYVYTRQTPPGWPVPPGRLDVHRLAEAGWSPSREPDCYVCGPTSFVEAVADLLVAAGHAAPRIRTERFGGA